MITTENIIDFRKKNAIFRRNIREAKRLAIAEFTSQINPKTTSSKIWSNIRSFCGIYPSKSIHAIYNPYSMSTSNDPYTIANTFAQFWSDSSSDTNFSHTFVTSKANINTTPTHFNPSQPGKKMDSDICPIELLSSVNSLKGHTPGMDRISYPMIKHAMPILNKKQINQSLQ